MSSSYLTYPEWYIVYSSREYSDFLKTNLPSGFPYFSSIEQYWCGYATVYRLSKSYPFNFDDHLMLVVIGISFSVEYAIKGLYENSIGRITELLSGHHMVDEDNYAQRVAEAYVNFIPYRPWFEFSFSNSLSGLWRETPLTGSNMIRKWERKLILSLEYSVKTVYAKLIGLGSHATLGTASDYVYATVKAQSIQAATCPKGKIEKTTSSNEYLVALPHEQPFTECVTLLAQNKATLMEIAGNRDILLSVIAPMNWHLDQKSTTVLFSMRILTNPEQKRVVLLVPVTELLELIRQLKNDDISIEHVYDY